MNSMTNQTQQPNKKELREFGLITGAIAAVLCELDFWTNLANAFFILARVPGLVAHAAEEQERQRPMRKIDPANHEYDGPSERHLED